MDSSDRINLPDEIWIQVFALLPADDRKRVRLTCFRFNDLCSCARFQSREELIFYGNVNSTEAILSLSDTCRKVWNISVNHVDILDDAILPFFEKQGTKVRSLIFNYCKFANGMVKSIIEQCPGLGCFALRYPRPQENVLNDFKALADNSIVCNNVVDLTLRMAYFEKLTNRKLLNVFDVFPNIRRLDLEVGVDYYPFNQLSFISADINSDEIFSFSCIYDRINALRDNLEKLSLTFGRTSKQRWCRPHRIVPKLSEIEMRNLKEFSLNWNFDPPNWNKFSFLSSFKYLTHFECDRVRLLSKEYTCALLKNLLDNAPSLRSLILNNFKILMDSELFLAFVRSKLISLSLLRDRNAPEFYINFEPSSLENSLSPNYTLEHLNIGPRPPIWMILLFSTFFRSLHRLDFVEVDGRVFQHIFEYQTKLHGLYLNNVQTMYTESEEPCPYQQWLRTDGSTINRRLEHLTHLTLAAQNYSLVKFMLGEFVLPRLENLFIWIRVDINSFNNELITNIRKFPQLKYLVLHLRDVISFAGLLALLSGFTKLRYLTLSDINTHKLQESEYRQIFNLVPSLRFLEHEYPCNSETVRFFYDGVTKTVMNISERKEDPILPGYKKLPF